jgi:hypothetical protein
MRLKLQNGEVLTAHVSHSNLPDHEVKRHGVLIRGGTSCGVHLGPCIYVEGQRGCQASMRYGMAFCSSLDNFNRAVGRKLAFTRAIETFSRPERTAFWKAFHEAQTRQSEARETHVEEPDHEC